MIDDFELNISEQEVKDGENKEGTEYKYPSVAEAGAEAEKENELAAQSLIKRIEGGETISDLEQAQIRAWGQNIDNLDKEVRTDFLFTLLDNPDKVSDETVYDAIMGLGLIDPESVLEMEIMITGGKDIAKAIKNIKVLQYLTYQNDYESEGRTAEDISKQIQAAWVDYQEAKENNFEKNGYPERREKGDNHLAAMMAARIVLENVKKKSKNFFIRAEIEQELEDIDAMRKDTERLRGEYDNPELKKNYNIPPVFAVVGGNGNSEYIKQMTEESTYCRLNDKYAVIYNPDDLAVDSFFALDQENGREAPKRLSIQDILEIEGFKKDHIGDDEFKRIALTYKTLVELPLRDRVEKKLKIKLEDYSVREQVQFVNFLSSKSISEVEEVKNFLDKGEGDAARKNRVKSFLSLEEGNEKSENIFAIGESLDQKTADAIFAKYAEIVDMTGKFREELDGMFKENREVSQKDLELISQNLIWRANKLLVDFSDKITKNKGDILEQLESYESDLVLTTAFFKSLKQSGAEIKLEDFKGVTFEDKAASEVSDDELKQMLKIYGDNYGNNFEYSADHRNTLVNNLYQKIANGRNDVKIYMYKMKTGKSDTIMVFSAFEDYGEGKRRGTAFNAIEPVAGSPIAKCFLKTILEMETADGMTVVAECDPRSPMSEDYVNRGFNVKGVTDNYPGKGELVLNIEISADNEKYEYKKYSAKDIIDEQGKYVEGDDKMVLNFKIDSAASLDEFMKEVNRMVKQGFVITKYLFGGDKKSVYCGFEKSPS